MTNQELEAELEDILTKYRLKGVVITEEIGKTISEINITPEIKNFGLYKVLLWDEEVARTTYNSLKDQIQPRLFAQGNECAFIFALYRHLFVVFTEKSTDTPSQFEASLTICDAITTAFLAVKNKPPAMIDNAATLFYTLITREYGHTGNTKHYVGGELIGEVPALAICQYHDDKGYYLFRCDEDWTTITDTFHVSIEEAMEQAEYEYTGLTAEKWKQYKTF